MASKKTNKLILFCIVLLSVFSFIFTNLEACHILNDPAYSEAIIAENDMAQSILPELKLVKNLFLNAIDILGSNF